MAVEWVFVASILVLGAVTALVAMRNALNSQLSDFAGAILSLDPQYEVRGVHNRESSTAGSAYIHNEIKIQGPLVGPNAKPPSQMTPADWRALDLAQNDPLPCD